MTTDTYRAAMRPLVLTAVWFALLAGTAFAWAAIEKKETVATASVIERAR